MNIEIKEENITSGDLPMELDVKEENGEPSGSHQMANGNENTSEGLRSKKNGRRDRKRKWNNIQRKALKPEELMEQLRVTTQVLTDANEVMLNFYYKNKNSNVFDFSIHNMVKAIRSLSRANKDLSEIFLRTV